MTTNQAMMTWPPPDAMQQVTMHMAACGCDPDPQVAQWVMDGTWCGGDTHTWADMMAMDKWDMQMHVWCAG